MAIVGLFSSVLIAQTYTAPAGIRPALRRQGTAILPGGRILAPLGRQFPTGSGPFGLALGPGLRSVVTANGGTERNSLTILERDKTGVWGVRHIPTRATEGDRPGDDGEERSDWRGVFMGVAYANDRSVYVSEGDSGRISLIDFISEEPRRAIDLNQSGVRESFSGDLALDSQRGFLYAVDQSNFRVAVIDTHSRQVVASVRVGPVPFAVALSPDRHKLYITNIRTSQNRAVPGPDPVKAHEAAGEPAAPESNSLCVIDVTRPAQAKAEGSVRIGLPGGSGPSGVVATADRVFVSNAGNDSITVIDARTNEVVDEIPIRIPGLESLRGVLPAGLAVHEKTGWLLVAEAGINAVGVIDPRERKVLGHLPVGWFPVRIGVEADNVFVANGRGNSSMPNAAAGQALRGPQRPGSVSIFPMPRKDELPAHTGFVMEANGFVGRPDSAPPVNAIQHVVLIVKENRTYDEVFGDIVQASNGAAMGAPELARFGSRGFADGKRIRLNVNDVNVTPNHHEIARRWAFSDNFYADADVSVGGRHWLVGADPLWHHLTKNGVSFYNFGEGSELAGVNTSREYPGFDMSVSDQLRATQFMKEIEAKFGQPGQELPRFLYIHLPNDHMAKPRPDDGYPYEASFVADNDYALGRILEYLSGTRWWKNMAVFITEDDAQGGLDHIDAHRTVLLCAGPWAKRGYVAHRNTSFPGLLKTIFRVLGVPPLNLFDATAADLSECLASTPGDTGPYKVLPVSKQLFDPETASR